MAWKCAQDNIVSHVFVSPGNAGTHLEEKVSNVEIDINNFSAIEDFCINESIKLVIIGPEQPLVEGLTNYLHSKNINTFGMYLDNYWYELTTNQENINSIDPVESLDVSILHDLIIEPLLGITDERTDPKIDFVGGARGLKELENRVDKDGFDIAFALFPTPIESLINVADANKVMPPKSTWFEPKLLDGLLSHLIN